MAQGSIWIHYKSKTKGIEEVLVIGKLKTAKSVANYYPRDFELKTIKAIQLTPYGVFNQAPGFFQGSVGSIGELDEHRYDGTPHGCYVVIKTFRGSPRAAGTPVHTHPTHMGTVAGGTLQANFMVIGA